jgi:hypothetical protein
MPIMFNSILREAGLSLVDVRLIRHKDMSAARGRTPYELWRDNRPEFERYQSTQTISNRTKFAAPYWAVFVANLQNETMFGGLYSAEYRGLLGQESPKPHMDGVNLAGSCDVYNLAILNTLDDLIGKLFIDWGDGHLAWVQRADRRDKPVVELRREFQEPSFPGYLNFIQPLSSLKKAPKSWIAALESSKGVYLLTCPRTKEQYVGSASGDGGFWGRWQDYVHSGHGGNVELKSRDPSDYQVSILEVAGTSLTDLDIKQLEDRWKTKLQSQKMGLNRN